MVYFKAALGVAAFMSFAPSQYCDSLRCLCGGYNHNTFLISQLISSQVRGKGQFDIHAQVSGKRHECKRSIRGNIALPWLPAILSMHRRLGVHPKQSQTQTRLSHPATDKLGNGSLFGQER